MPDNWIWKEAVITAPTRKKKPPVRTDPGPFRSRSLAPIGWIVAAGLAAAGLLAYVFAPEERSEPPPPQAAVVEKPIPPPPPPPPKPKPPPDGPNDVLGRAPDLKSVFMKYRDSRNPIERALAGRAVRACFPLFTPPLDQPASVAHVLSTLPPEYRAARRPAIEALFERCRSFFVQPMDLAEIVRNAQRAANGDLATPGALVRWSLTRGDRAAAESTATLALNSKEPYALQSLAGLSLLFMNEQSRGKDPAATDAALVLLACDFGAACGADTLLALELCANEGRCTGTARDRMLARVGATDSAAVEREHARLRMLLDNGVATVDTVWRGGR
jgi:hypothetical protein